jgi:hypothetical protein
MDARYIYKLHELRPRSGEIRLPYVEPSDDVFSPLEFSLRVVSPRDPPPSSTLSYCWGKYNLNCKMFCRGFKAFPISCSLDKALRSFLALKGRLIWVDQTCIYQDRYRSKCCRSLRFESQFCKAVGFAHLTCRIGKFTLRVFIMEIYRYMAFYLHLAFASPCPFFVSI